VVPALAVLVVQHRMAMSKGTATRVLAGDTHGVSTGDQRGKRQVFAHAPVNSGFATSHGAPVVQQTVDQRVDREAFWDGGEFFTDTLKFCQRHTGIGVVGPLSIQERGPVSRVLALEIGKNRLNGAL